MTDGAARCGTHEGAQAIGACARCGTFVCPLCLDAYSGLPEHCEACRAREGGGLIAFERPSGGLLGRWWTTSKAIVFSPRRVLETSRPESLKSSLLYVALTGSIVGVLSSLGALPSMWSAGEWVGDETLRPLVREDPSIGLWVSIATWALSPLFVPVGLATSALLRASVFHGVSRLLGGAGAFRQSLWAMNYLHGISLMWIPLALTQYVPFLGPVLNLLVTLCIEVYYANQMILVATRWYRLEGARAAFAGWVGFVSLVGLAVLFGLAVWLPLAVR